MALLDELMPLDELKSPSFPSFTLRSPLSPVKILHVQMKKDISFTGQNSSLFLQLALDFFDSMSQKSGDFRV
jgi:hypothetical protein